MQPWLRTLSVNLALFFPPILWSGFHVLGKASFDFVHPLWFVFFRVFLGALLLQAVNFAFVARGDCRAMLPKTPGIFVRMLLVGFTGFYLNSVFFILGLRLSSATQAGISQTIIPAVATTLALLFGMERFLWLKPLGIVLAVVGVATVSVGPAFFGYTDSQTEANALAGACFVLQSTAYAVSVLIARSLKGEPATLTTGWGFTLSALLCLPTAASFSNPVPLSEWPPLVFLSILYAAWLGGVLAFALNVYATAHTTPSVVTIYGLLQAIASPVFGAIFLGEQLTVFHAAGGALIIVGVVTVVYARSIESSLEEQQQQDRGSGKHLQQAGDGLVSASASRAGVGAAAAAWKGQQVVPQPQLQNGAAAAAGAAGEADETTPLIAQQQSSAA